MNIVNKVTGDSLTASEFNQIPDELENLISSAGNSPSDLNLTQVASAVSQYSNDGNFYTTGGSADSITLTSIRTAPTELSNGFKARFIALYDNTGATTVNVANLGAKNLKYNNANLTEKMIVKDNYYEIVYNDDENAFELQLIDYVQRNIYDSVADLKNDSKIRPNFYCITKGYYSANDGGEGEYIIREKVNTDVDNGGSILFITGTNYVAELVIKNNIINVKQFGAKGDGVTDDNEKIQNAINFASQYTNKYTVYLPQGNYITSLPIIVYQQMTILGQSRYFTKIIKNTNNKKNHTIPILVGGVTYTDDYNVDSIINIYHPNNGHTYNITIQNLTLEGKYDNTYAIFAPRLAHSIFKNILAKRIENGFFTYNAWLCVFESLSIDCSNTGVKFVNDGSGSGCGTTCTMIDVNVDHCTYGFDLYGLGYSTMIDCAVDNCSNYSYKFNGCHLTMNGCGTEGVTTGRAIVIDWNNRIDINNMNISFITRANGNKLINIAEGSYVNINNIKIQHYLDPDFSGTFYELSVRDGSANGTNPSHLVDKNCLFTNYGLHSVIENSTRISISKGQIIKTINNVVYNEDNNFINDSKCLLTGDVNNSNIIYSKINSLAHSTFTISASELINGQTVGTDGLMTPISNNAGVRKPNLDFSSGTILITERFKPNGFNGTQFILCWGSIAVYTRGGAGLSVIDMGTNTSYSITANYTMSTGRFYDLIITEDLFKVYDSETGETIGTLEMPAPVLTALRATNFLITYGGWANTFDGVIDLKYFNYVNDGIIKSSCNITGTKTETINGNSVTFSYFESKSGSRVVAPSYRTNISDLYEQDGKALYFTLDELNQDYTLPKMDLYGVITKIIDAI